MAHGGSGAKAPPFAARPLWSDPVGARRRRAKALRRRAPPAAFSAALPPALCCLANDNGLQTRVCQHVDFQVCLDCISLLFANEGHSLMACSYIGALCAMTTTPDDVGLKPSAAVRPVGLLTVDTRGRNSTPHGRST